MTNNIVDHNLNVPKNATSGRHDLLNALTAYSFWSYLAWHDIRIRYRYSKIGPFWLTLSTAIFCITIALVYSLLFKTQVEELLPFVAIGSVIWGFISGSITEMPNIFVVNAPYVKDTRINLHTIILRAICRDLIVLAHHLIIVVGIYIYFKFWPGWSMLYVLPGLALISLNLFAIGTTLSVVGARYRDTAQITQSILQIAFFITPIFWLPRLLPEGNLILVANPFTYLIDLVREPLLGRAPSLSAWVASFIILLINSVLATLVFRWGRHRITFWV